MKEVIDISTELLIAVVPLAVIVYLIIVLKDSGKDLLELISLAAQLVIITIAACYGLSNFPDTKAVVSLFLVVPAGIAWLLITL